MNRITAGDIVSIKTYYGTRWMRVSSAPDPVVQAVHLQSLDGGMGTIVHASEITVY
jgi:hypothetical protein